MRVLSNFLIAASVALCCNAQAQDAQAISKATVSAERWLALLDAHDYGATWVAAAPASHKLVSQAAWEQALQSARTPLGEVKARTLKSATFRRNLGGAPAGDYVVIVYETQFAGPPSPAVETVIPMRDSDGSWKVSGYFVR